MARPSQSDSGALVLGGIIGAVAGGGSGAFLGALAGAAVSNQKLPLEQAIVDIARQNQCEIYAQRWTTRHSLEVALRKGTGPLQVARLNAAFEGRSREDVLDQLYDQFVHWLNKHA